VLCLNSQNETCHDRSTTTRTVFLPLPAVEVSLAQQQLPEAGSPTSQPRILDESHKDEDLSLTVEGVAGTTVNLFLRTNMLSPSNKRATDIKVEGAERFGDKLQVNFPQGSGFVTQKVHISWPK
jgi:hypothetical protein